MRIMGDQPAKVIDVLGTLSLGASLLMMVLIPFNEYFPFVGRTFFTDAYLFLAVPFLVYCGWAWGDLLRHGSFSMALKVMFAVIIAIILLLGLPTAINPFPHRLIWQMPAFAETGLGWVITAVVLLTPAVLGVRVYKKLRWGWLAAILVFVVSPVAIFGLWYFGPWELQ
ncbi:hypothetical protein [Calidithermus chliarophilus]|uniref:hypothetical protein n=1 Tax=Calidithermus chliarophilus TaxID=52023 RepID=UPI0012F6FA0B|nr:hypothetical protein [Calidithermus chliarophilus]